jgi:aminoglycoside phosphotransferase (APT) family kinase protein
MSTVSEQLTVNDLLTQHVSAARPQATGVESARMAETKNGYSNTNEVFVATWEEGGRTERKEFVVRSQVEGNELFYDTDLAFQWRVMEALASHSDIPVPPLAFSSFDRSVTGSRFFVMDKVEGRVPPNGPSYHQAGWVSELTPAQRSTMVDNALEMLVRIHALDWRKGFAFLDRPDRGASGIEQQIGHIDEWYRWTAKGRTFPVLEAAIAYLREHRPVDAVDGVSWGDSRVGNMIFAPDLSVAAVLDWEMAALGPPEMDVAWWFVFEEVWTSTQGIPRAEGVPGPDGIRERYAALGGKPMGDLFYYEILGWMRLILTCVRMVAPNVEDDAEPLADGGFIRLLADRLDVPCVVVS